MCLIGIFIGQSSRKILFHIKSSKSVFMQYIILMITIALYPFIENLTYSLAITRMSLLKSKRV